MKLQHFTILLLLLVMGAGCSDYTRKYPAGGTDFLPLREGRALRYRLTEHGDTHEYTMSLRYLGGKEYKVFKASFDGYYPGGLEFESHELQVEALMQYSYTTLKPRTQQAEFTQLWIDESLVPGDIWEDEDTGTQTVFTGYESVTVPAGTYEGCYHTVTEAMPAVRDSLEAWLERGMIDSEQFEAELANSRIVTQRWFAQGIGLVREEIGSSDHVRELLAVEAEGFVDTTNTNTESNL